MIPYNRKLKQRSQLLRREATPEETKLWYEFLSALPCRFVRQKPLGNYIVDFYAPAQKLVIEVDGSQHYTEQGLEGDQIRDDFLNAYGLRVLRIRNEEVREDFALVREKIKNMIDMNNMTSEAHEKG